MVGEVRISHTFAPPPFQAISSDRGVPILPMPLDVVQQARNAGGVYNTLG